MKSRLSKVKYIFDWAAKVKIKLERSVKLKDWVFLFLFFLFFWVFFYSVEVKHERETNTNKRLQTTTFKGGIATILWEVGSQIPAHCHCSGNHVWAHSLISYPCVSMCLSIQQGHEYGGQKEPGLFISNENKGAAFLHPSAFISTLNK